MYQFFMIFVDHFQAFNFGDLTNKI